MDDFLATWRERVARTLASSPFIAAIKAEIPEAADGRARMRLPYNPDLVGNPDTGVIHGGVITGLLDHSCGAAIMSALDVPMPMVTLDLRIDYMRPAKPKADIFVDAECLKVGHEIAFARAVAYQDDKEKPIAYSSAAFMIFRAGGLKVEKPA
ncbi:MAG TPA: PaaI family thioesterase [Rhizomicrobium sp.]|jgi:uncharacterized protein (TIGR00369 family)|nr:PaaI family thioesterase [Rhizomicrobium sp.]HEX4533952.1 PaaI family thioesterase [Rhizomicrobium sp.]